MHAIFNYLLISVLENKSESFSRVFQVYRTKHLKMQASNVLSSVLSNRIGND